MGFFQHKYYQFSTNNLASKWLVTKFRVVYLIPNTVKMRPLVLVRAVVLCGLKYVDRRHLTTHISLSIYINFL